MSAFRRWYGAGPLHAIVLVISATVIATAVVRWFDAGADTIKILAWFGAAVIGHDLVFLPLYTLLDRLATGRWRRRDADRDEPAWTSAYVRVPALLSALMFIVFLPLIAGLGRDSYHAASGHDPRGYLERWLIATAVLFALAAAAFVLRRRGARRGAA